MLKIAGWHVHFGPICPDAKAVGVWGRKRLAKRGFKAANRRGLPVLTVEDAFLRSTQPGPGSAPEGLIIDETGIFFDASEPSGLENILNGDGLESDELLHRAKDGIAFLRRNGLSKYNPVPRRAQTKLTAGYVLVVDQTVGDASVSCGQAGPETFAKMLVAARAENPDSQIYIRTHPSVKAGNKLGYFGQSDCDSRTSILDEQINPWDLLEAAKKVYCVTSQMGFEAILAGHRPRVFGMPFYAGWGLTTDEQTLARRIKIRSAEQLFAAAMIEYPVWIDPFQNRICSFETAAQNSCAKAKLAWAALPNSIAVGMSSWKIPQVSRFLGYQKNRPKFSKSVSGALQKANTADRIVIWASKETPALAKECAVKNIPLWRMEDGFLRSSGLGAELTPADSVVLDDLGIYFDATRPSRLEKLIESSVNLPQFALNRAEKLRGLICATGVTKYNLDRGGAALPDTKKTKILVPGQVEDDASITFGTSDITTNLDLLRATRAANPEAFIIYKPHPDVEAGLRLGAIENAEEFADIILENASVPALLALVDEVWTMTSLLGFEALLRGVRVHCFGMPFYAGWGLTDDRHQTNARRGARPSLGALVHACLIEYPLYLDPVTMNAISPERLVDRLALRRNPRGIKLRIIAKIQSRFAGISFLWR